MSGARKARVDRRETFPFAGSEVVVLVGEGGVQFCWVDAFTGNLILNRFCATGTAAELRAIADMLDTVSRDAFA